MAGHERRRRYRRRSRTRRRSICHSSGSGSTGPSPRNIAARHAFTVSDEVGEAARSASTIRPSPQDDGDVLYQFEKDGTVVYEVLASEAGIEPGYDEAYDAAYADPAADFGSYSAWVVAGSTATQTKQPSVERATRRRRTTPPALHSW